MAFGSGISTERGTEAALDLALAQALAGFSTAPDLGFVFATPHHLEAAQDLADAIDRVAAVGVGAIAEGVIGNAIEIEDGPGVAVWLGSLPGAVLDSRHLEAVRTPQGVAVGGTPVLDGVVGAIMMADPFTFPTGEYTVELAARRIPVVGGFANSSQGPGGAALLRGGEVHHRGSLMITFSGEVDFNPIVSPGCRPIGEPAVVTGAVDSTVSQIAGRPALSYVRDGLARLDPAERAAAARGLQVGVVVDESKLEYAAGDFLIRGITAVDEATGALTVGDRLDVGTTIQLQIRDSAAADDELRRLVADVADPGGMLLFSCNARGERFFGSPHHDAGVIADVVGPPALAGFFAAGELGPVGRGNYIHTFTASMAVLRGLAE